MITTKVLGDFIGGRFERPAGAERKIISRDPGDSGYRIGSFPVYPQHVESAVVAARQALPAWRALDISERADVLRRFTAEVVNCRRELRELVAAETGRPLFEAEEEVSALEAQAEIEIREGVRFVSPFQVKGIRHGVEGRCNFRPLGVVAVLGSAVSPVHLACAHILPALLAGNTVVFKPSKLVPACGQFLARVFEEIQLPAGAFNLVQGDAAAGWELAAHSEVEGVLFTGSFPTGQRILEATVGQPHKLVALQMGGINTAVVLDDADLETAVYETVCGAFLTAGQRYGSTRLVVVEEALAPRFAEAFVEASRRLKVGYAFDPGVFMGPMLSETARDRALDQQEKLSALGLRTLLHCQPLKPGRPGYYVSPGVYALDLPEARAAFHPDGLFFGPQAVLVAVSGEGEALDVANLTEFGFCAAVFTADPARFDRLAEELRFGVINHNLGTTDQSLRLPLDGAGRCGNNRPAGVFNQRNCCFPVASLIATGASDPDRRRKVFPR
jgi:succinylglutamic semialdehyde dehydrogenase